MREGNITLKIQGESMSLKMTYMNQKKRSILNHFNSEEL